MIATKPRKKITSLLNQYTGIRARVFISFFALLLLAFRGRGVHGKNGEGAGARSSSSAPGMVKQTQLSLNDAAEWLGDWHPLAEQLGSTDGLVTLGSVSTLLRLRPVRDVES